MMSHKNDSRLRCRTAEEPTPEENQHCVAVVCTEWVRVCMRGWLEPGEKARKGRRPKRNGRPREGSDVCSCFALHSCLPLRCLVLDLRYPALVNLSCKYLNWDSMSLTAMYPHFDCHMPRGTNFPRLCACRITPPCSETHTDGFGTAL